MTRKLLLTVDFPPRRGGVARYLAQLAADLAPTMSVFALPEEGSALFDASQPYDIAHVPFIRDTGWPRWSPALRILADARDSYDVLYVSHVLPLGIVALINKWRYGKPYIVLLHGMDVELAKRNLWKRFLFGLILRGAASVTVNSRALAADVKPYVGHVPVAIREPRPDTALLEAARLSEPSYRNADAPLRLLTVGRLVPRKGHRFVLEALEQIPEALYTIVGDGPERESLLTLAEERGLTNRVQFIRSATDAQLPALYAAHDIFVMPVQPHPTDREGFGIVYLEAAAFGLPVIASRFPGVDEAVIDSVTGVLVEPGDADAFLAILRLLITDPALAERLGRAGRRRLLGDEEPRV